MGGRQNFPTSGELVTQAEWDKAHARAQPHAMRSALVATLHLYFVNQFDFFTEICLAARVA